MHTVASPVPFIQLWDLLTLRKVHMGSYETIEGYSRLLQGGRRLK
jgi:hypothetical protein